MSDLQIKDMCRCYKRCKVYSKRYKKGIQKQVSLIHHTEKEACEILEAFTKEIKDDNDRYIQEKNKDDKEKFEKNTPFLEGTDQIKGELEKLSVDKMFDKFDTDLASNVLIIANSKCGKTYLLKQMVEKWMAVKKDLIVIWMIGNKNADVYQDIIDRKDYVFFDGYKPSIIETIHVLNNEIDHDDMYEFLFIIDDIIEQRNSSTINNLAMSYRNCKMNSIFVIQDCTLIMPKARDNATVQIYGQSKSRALSKIYENFLKPNDFFKKHGKNESEKLNIYRKLCADYHFLATFPLENDGDKLYDLKAE